MLPKSRIVSALLVGLGIALIVGGLVAPRFLDADGRLPLGLEHTTYTLRDDAATTRLLADGRQLQSPVVKQLHLDIQEPASAEAASVRIGSTLMRESGQDESDRLIMASTWGYELDRLSGEAKTPANLTHTLGMPPQQVDVNGVWLKFPSNPEQTTYEVFDETLRQARPATFVEAEEIDGREVYRYRQEIEPTNVAHLYASLFNTADIEGDRGVLYHSAKTDFVVDAVTGLVVDVETEINDFYAAPGTEGDEAARVPFLVFEGSRDDAQVQAAVAELNGSPAPATMKLIRWIVVGVGFVILLFALAGAFLSGQAKGKRRKAAK